MAITRNRRYFLSKKLVDLEIKRDKVFIKLLKVLGMVNTVTIKMDKSEEAIKNIDIDTEKCQAELNKFNDPSIINIVFRPYHIVSLNTRILTNSIRKSILQPQFEFWFSQERYWTNIYNNIDFKYKAIREQINNIRAELQSGG